MCRGGERGGREGGRGEELDADGAFLAAVVISTAAVAVTGTEQVRVQVSEIGQGKAKGVIAQNASGIGTGDRENGRKISEAG